MKNLIKKVIPQLILDLWRSYKSPWKGDFQDWESARIKSNGYSNDTFFSKLKDSASKVKDGIFPYERDTVLFDEVQYSWPLVCHLLQMQLDYPDGFSVLDFGGGLGSSYHQNKRFLKNKNIRWIVVEQQEIVQIGKNEFQTEQLYFVESLEEVKKRFNVEFILVSSTLQYIEKPYELIEKMKALNAEIIFLDRLSVTDQERDIITLQSVPGDIYKTSYPCRFFFKNKIVNSMISRYRIVDEFESYVPNHGVLNFKYKFHDIGVVFKKIT